MKVLRLVYATELKCKPDPGFGPTERASRPRRFLPKHHSNAAGLYPASTGVFAEKSKYSGSRFGKLFPQIYRNLPLIPKIELK
jgi:hypothetical protein